LEVVCRGQLLTAELLYAKPIILREKILGDLEAEKIEEKRNRGRGLQKRVQETRRRPPV